MCTFSDCIEQRLSITIHNRKCFLCCLEMSEFYFSLLGYALSLVLWRYRMIRLSLHSLLVVRCSFEVSGTSKGAPVNVAAFENWPMRNTTVLDTLSNMPDQSMLKDENYAR